MELIYSGAYNKSNEFQGLMSRFWELYMRPDLGANDLAFMNELTEMIGSPPVPDMHVMFMKFINDKYPAVFDWLSWNGINLWLDDHGIHGGPDEWMLNFHGGSYDYSYDYSGPTTGVGSWSPPLYSHEGSWHFSKPLPDRPVFFTNGSFFNTLVSFDEVMYQYQDYVYMVTMDFYDAFMRAVESYSGAIWRQAEEQIYALGLMDDIHCLEQALYGGEWEGNNSYEGSWNYSKPMGPPPGTSLGSWAAALH